MGVRGHRAEKVTFPFRCTTLYGEGLSYAYPLCLLQSEGHNIQRLKTCASPLLPFFFCGLWPKIQKRCTDSQNVGSSHHPSDSMLLFFRVEIIFSSFKIKNGQSAVKKRSKDEKQPAATYIGPRCRLSLGVRHLLHLFATVGQLYLRIQNSVWISLCRLGYIYDSTHHSKIQTRRTRCPLQRPPPPLRVRRHVRRVAAAENIPMPHAQSFVTFVSE